MKQKLGPLSIDPLSPAQAILFGTFVVGTLDILDAITFFGLRGVPPVRIFQSIASGLLGRDAFSGGPGVSVLGGLLHYTIAFGIVTTYFFVSRKLTGLARHPLLYGPVFGIAVYAVMNLIVVPLSAAASHMPSLPVFLNGISIHMLGIGIPAALAAWAVPPAPLSEPSGVEAAEPPSGSSAPARPPSRS